MVGISMFFKVSGRSECSIVWTARFAGLSGSGIRICKGALKSLSLNCVNVDISIDELRVERVWYDVSTKKLFVQAKDFVNGIPFGEIPEADFESGAPVNSFSIGHDGATIVCHHKDGKETWLPSDMWLPGGFTAGK
jgi:hypothetical protein